MSRRFSISDLLVSGVIILLAIVFSPIWVPIFAYVSLKQKVAEWRFTRYVKNNDGKKFFCYTHRQNSAAFVREHVFPILPPEVEVIYITDRFDTLEEDSKFSGQIISKMAEKKQGFPCLAKFANGEFVIESVNHELYQTIVRKRDRDKLIQRIVQFYAS